MNDLDSFLNELGVGPSETPPANTSVEQIVSNLNLPPSEPTTQQLTDSDFDDILESNDFIEMQEPEDVTDEDEEREERMRLLTTLHVGEVIQAQTQDTSTYSVTNDGIYRDGTLIMDREQMENIAEHLDIDAEEDADWMERIESGELTEVDSTRTEEPVATQQPSEPSQPQVPSDPSLIPLNSPTLLVNDSTSRFSGTEWYSLIQQSRIILAGLGGIGSWTALQLARMCPATICLYDDDTVETANESGQFYGRNQVGQHKADAMASLISDFTATRNVYAITSRFTSSSDAGDIMICGFDNMTARKTFFQSWKQHVRQKPEEERRDCVFIDGRLSIDTLQVFCIPGDDTYNMNRYEQEFLFDDSEADETVCSMKQTTYMACMISSFIVNLFTNWVADRLDPILPYDLPFFTEYDAQNMLFKTIK